MGYFGHIQPIQSTIYRLLSSIQPSRHPIQHPTGGSRRSSTAIFVKIGIYGPVGLWSQNSCHRPPQLSQLTLQPPQSSLALVVPQQAIEPARPPQQATTTIDQQQHRQAIQQTKQASSPHSLGGLWSRARVTKENISLKVYFSLGLPEVQWRHDFYQYKKFQPEKEGSSRSHQLLDVHPEHVQSRKKSAPEKYVQKNSFSSFNSQGYLL